MLRGGWELREESWRRQAWSVMSQSGDRAGARSATQMPAAAKGPASYLRVRHAGTEALLGMCSAVKRGETAVSQAMGEGVGSGFDLGLAALLMAQVQVVGFCGIERDVRADGRIIKMAWSSADCDCFSAQQPGNMKCHESHYVRA